MKNTKTITFHYEDSEQVINIDYVPVAKTWVDCKLLLQDFPNGCFLERTHQFLQTKFILDDTEPCKLIVFDANGSSIGTKTHSYTGGAPFSYLISEQYVVIVPMGNSIIKENIDSFNFKN